MPTKKPEGNPDLPPVKDNTPPPPPQDPLPPRAPLEKPKRDDEPVPEEEPKEAKLPESHLPDSYFDSNGHPKPWSYLDPLNITDSMNNDQYHYRNQKISTQRLMGKGILYQRIDVGEDA